MAKIDDKLLFLRTSIKMCQEEIEILRKDVQRAHVRSAGETLWWVILSAGVLILYLIVIFGDKQ